MKNDTIHERREQLNKDFQDLQTRLTAMFEDAYQLHTDMSKMNLFGDRISTEALGYLREVTSAIMRIRERLPFDKRKAEEELKFMR